MTTNPVFFSPRDDPHRHAMPPRIPQVAHRHGTPSGPWPWADVVEFEEPNFLQLLPILGGKPESPVVDISPSAKMWREYPGILFPNWIESRLLRSGIAAVMRKKHDEYNPCVVYEIDVEKDGHFSTESEHEKTKLEPQMYDEFWKRMNRSDTIGKTQEHRLKAIFVENMTGPVLQMLGAMYKIEPFYFSSSLNWIPSRYQEEAKKGEGDHITLTLTFLRALPNPNMTEPSTPATRNGYFTQRAVKAGTVIIDTQAPLPLRSNDKILLIDLIAFHMVRRKGGSIIVSYHPTPEWKTTSARYLHSKVRFVGESVYWQNIFRQSKDPTFVLLSMLWYALYAWDEALESLYHHISWLESRVLVTNDINLTRDLHVIRASILHYKSLLENFRKSVVFVRVTPNPAMEDEPEKEDSAKLMEKECDNLLSEIERLEMYRAMQETRLDNIMDLVFNSVTLEDSRVMKRMAEQSLRDGTAMKQISYLTMVFLPASFVSVGDGDNLLSRTF
ncbi:hypothetical protein CPB83DRAFT_862724 [Crepidotus variabilis]|uniref:Uncharacterized protein n=1 Tax=Crepidotus variabilis TaxID=179855 RepID=A0A9P6E6K5_9AGAR|nr:hypothetical protein CPB83DRAFT_862724 [Crepidotus variabilis]